MTGALNTNFQYRKLILGLALGLIVSAVYLSIWPNSPSKVALALSYTIMAVPALLQEAVFAALPEFVSLRYFVSAYWVIVGGTLGVISSRKPRTAVFLLTSFLLIHVAFGFYVGSKSIFS